MNIIKNLYHKYFDLSLKDRSILTSKLSILYQLISASTKLVLGILTSQIFIITAGIYSAGIFTIKLIYLVATINNKDDTSNKNYFLIINVLLLINSVVYILYSLRYFINPEFSNYSLIISIAITVFCFTDFIIAIVGLFKSNKENDVLLVAIKIVSLTSANTSLALTQAVLLAYDGFFNNIDYGIYIGLGAVFFGSINVIISLFMYQIYLTLNISYHINTLNLNT